MPDLALAFLGVSCLSLACQVLAFTRLAAQRAATPVEELVGAGYLRTVACRVLAAVIYVAVAVAQLSGDGSLSAEALVVFTSVQAIWQANSLMDIRARRALSQRREPPGAR